MNFDTGDAIEAALYYNALRSVVIAEGAPGYEWFEFVEIGCAVFDSVREKNARFRRESPRSGNAGYTGNAVAHGAS